MRRWIIAPILLLAGSVIAEDRYQIDHECSDGNIIFQVSMRVPGTLTFQVPHDLCGKDV
jgi:hypothetical protein